MNMMKMTQKLGAGLLAALVALTLGAGAAFADPDASNDNDSLTIRITPSVDLGVNVDTTTAQFQGGSAGQLDMSLALNATGYLVSPASVTILGNFSNQEVELVGQSLDTWTLDANEEIGGDSMQVYALFASNKSSRPVEGEFAANTTRNLVTTTPSVAGQAVGDEGTAGLLNSYELDSGMTGLTNMDNMAVGALKQLWLRVDSPSSTTSDENQRVTITLTAKSGVLN